MNTFVKKLVSGIAALTMCLSVAPIGASADATDIEAIQEEFNKVESAQPDYVEFECINLEDGTTSTLFVDDNIDGLVEYQQSQEVLDEFISTCSIISGSTLQYSADMVENRIGRVKLSNGIGTGFLIAPDLVLTAGHCVSNITNDTSIVFQPGYDDGVSLVDQDYKAEYVFRRSDYVSGTQTDFAIIKLVKAVGNNPSVGYCDIAIPTSTLVNKSVTVKGYPGTMSCEYQMYSNGTLKTLSCTDSDVAGMLGYDASTYSGMSGSPVYCSNGDVIGVHSRGYSSSYNCGVRITGQIYRFTMVDFYTAIDMS